MGDPHCSICNANIDVAEYDLKQTHTLKTKTPLFTILKSCVNTELFFNNYAVCKVCYLLLLELDTVKLRVKEIEDQFKHYLRNKNEKSCYMFYNDINVKYDSTQDDSVQVNSSYEALDTNSDCIDIKEKKLDIKFSIDANEKEKSLFQISKPFSCTECPKVWKTLSELKNHMSAHSSERPFICEICGQGYKRQQALTVHVGMHRGINPFTCVYCKKSFTQKGALARHMPLHTGELPYQCDLCGKRFVHHTSFNIHKLSHTGEKSYKCDTCGLLLISGSHLKRHMRVHTGEKRFSCTTCGKKFAEKYNLAVHEKLHLGISRKKKFKCHICDNFYGGQLKLEEHLLNVHQSIQYSDLFGVLHT